MSLSRHKAGDGIGRPRRSVGPVVIWSVTICTILMTSSIGIGIGSAQGITAPRSVHTVGNNSSTSSSGDPNSTVAGVMPPGARTASNPTGLGGTPQVAVGAGARFATHTGPSGYVYVPNYGGSSVSLISGSSNVGTITVGTNPISATYDPDDGYVYISNHGSWSVSIVNGATVLATRTVTSGSQPAFAAYDASNHYVYVADAASSDTVEVLSGTTLLAPVTVGSAPHSATYDPANGAVYVPCWGSNAVYVIGQNGVVTSVAVGSEPLWAILDAGNGYLYVTNSGSSSVSVINGATNLLVSTLAVGSTPNGVTYDSFNGYMYVSNSGSGTVSVIAGTTVIASVTVGSDPAFSSVDSSNQYVFITNTGSSTMSLLRETTVLGTVNVGSSPMSAMFDPNNDWVYVPNSASGNVSLIEALLTLHVFDSPPSQWNSAGGNYGELQLGSSLHLGDLGVYEVLPGNTYPISAVGMPSQYWFDTWMVYGGNVAKALYATTTLTVGQTSTSVSLEEVVFQLDDINWAGYAQSGSQVSTVGFYMYVPQVSYDQNFACSDEQVTFWAGIGGYLGIGTDQLWQAGLVIHDECTNLGLFDVYSTYYCPFSELSNSQTSGIVPGGVPWGCFITAGDEIYVWVSYAASTGYVDWGLTDYGQGGVTSVGGPWQPAPVNDPDGLTGEVEAEGPVCSPVCHMPYWNEATFLTPFFGDVANPTTAWPGGMVLTQAEDISQFITTYYMQSDGSFLVIEG